MINGGRNDVSTLSFPMQRQPYYRQTMDAIFAVTVLMSRFGDGTGCVTKFFDQLCTNDRVPLEERAENYLVKAPVVIKHNLSCHVF